MAYGQQDLAYPVKLIKGLISPWDLSYTTRAAGQLWFKFVYEFWGFCINGTDDLQNPGGFAVSGTQLPIGFTSGSNTLLAAGSDGQTDFGGSTFGSTSANFLGFGTGSLFNKYLVIWKTNDPSPDDSIYRIVGVQDANHIQVRVDTGGTTRLGGKASFSARSGIRYRIFDPNAVVSLTGWNTASILQSASLVMNFAAAPNVNPGQSVSQLKLDLMITQSIVKMTVSPSGSWIPASGTFTDASTPISQSWFVGGSSGRGQFFLHGGREFLITFMKGEDGAWNSGTPVQPGLHIEIPTRLYPPANDPNPVAWTMWTDSGGTAGLSPTTGSYAQGWKMVCQDGVLRDWVANVRVPSALGERTHYLVTPASGGVWYGFTQANAQFGTGPGRSHFNLFSGTYATTDAVLMQTGSVANQQFSMSRVRLRRVRFSARNLPPYLRLGERWVHVGGGVLWPWDGSQLPEGLFWEAGGAQPAEVEG